MAASSENDISMNLEVNDNSVQEDPLEKEGPKIKFILNSKGKESAFYKGFMYHYHYIVKGTNRSYYRCTDRKCPGRLHIITRLDGEKELFLALIQLYQEVLEFFLLLPFVLVSDCKNVFQFPLSPHTFHLVFS